MRADVLTATSGSPLVKKSRPKRGRLIKCSPALRIAASARSRCARPSANAGASSSAGSAGSGKEQARLEEREPRRHDQIVGGKLEAQFAGGLDEQQILFGERENGNARQVDPLPSSEFQQEVERAFETIEVDGERGLARRLSEVEIGAKPFRCQRITSVAHGGAPGGAGKGGPSLFDRRRCSERPEIYGFLLIV